MIFWDEEPKKPKKIPKGVRDLVWIKYMKDNTEGKCYCCRIRTITIFDFEVGHNKAKSKGGTDNVSNLRPICKSCNLAMGTQSIESFRAKHFGKPKSKSAKSKAVKKKTTKKKSDSIFDW